MLCANTQSMFFLFCHLPDETALIESYDGEEKKLTEER